MNNFYLVRKNLTRNKMRLFLNCFAIIIAFLLFGVLTSLQQALTSGVELTADNRLVVVNKINFTQPLPYAYLQKIRAVEGVDQAVNLNWFGGFYQDPRNQIISFAVDPENYFSVFLDASISDDQLKVWQSTRTGALIGSALAEKMGWNIGDKIPLSSNIFSQSDGSHTWELEITGIFTGKDVKQDTNYLLLHYKYFIETQTFGGDWIGWVTVLTADASQNQNIASAIDKLFQNSKAETETTTEKQFSKSFLEQFGNIALILTSVVGAAFFTILLIVGNTVALSVRERAREIAVLKTIGFSAKRIFGLILSESILLAVLGGSIGLLIATVVVTGATQAPGLSTMLPGLAMNANVVATAIFYMLLLGVVTGGLPAWRAMKLNTIDALNGR